MSASKAPIGRRGRRPSRHRQRGLSLIVLISLFALVGFFGLLAARSLPAWNEYFSIKRAVTKIESSGDTDLASIRRTFENYATVDRIESIRPADLVITRQGTGVRIDFSYEARIPVAYNMEIVFTFSRDLGG